MILMTFIYLQAPENIRWNLSHHYDMNVRECISLTVALTGEVIAFVRTQEWRYEVHWYNQQGELTHTLQRPFRCKQSDNKLLAIFVEGKEQIALSCSFCKCIWVGSKDSHKWSIAWEAIGNKVQPEPRSMSCGKPGQIIAGNGKLGARESVSVFNITKIPFDLAIPEIDLKMFAGFVSYCDLPGVGGGLAVTATDFGYDHLSMFNLNDGSLIWREKRNPGDNKFRYKGLCSDNNGRLYVADQLNSRIVVFSAATGSVLQEIKHEQMGQPWHLCWHEPSNSIILQSTIGYPSKHCISYYILQS